MTTSSDVILTLDDLTVGRGEFHLCQGVNLTLLAQEICHLVGENGLGKTTLLHQIAGLLPIPHGKVITPHRPVYITHQLGINPVLTVTQNLRFLLSLYHADTHQDVLEFALDKVGLYGLGDTPSNQLSAGQTRRIGLARLFVLTPTHSPLWLLDEPLTALDVGMVAQLEQQMANFAGLGGAILATSHQRMLGATKTLDLADFAL